MTGLATIVVSAATFIVGAALAVVGLLAREAGTSVRVAGPVRTRPDYGLQAVGLVLFVVGAVLVAAALSAAGWFA